MSVIGGLLVLVCGFLITRGTAPPDAFFFLCIGLLMMFKDYILKKR
jgi:hypothetical protein